MSIDLGLKDYLSKLNDTYSRKNNQSLSDILDTFNQLSDSYVNLNNTKNNKLEYSSYDFWECSNEERKRFYDDQLQLVECLVLNSLYDKSGIILNWGDIFKLIIDKDYAHTEKINRRMVYSTSYNQRPTGENSYAIWNGFQVIDLDIKNAELANKLKLVIFKELKKYHWFLGVSLSASKKSLHVWTKITPLSFNIENKRTEYMCNFRHKFSYVFIVLQQYIKEFGYTKEDTLGWLDMAMAKPAQGSFIPSDFHPMLNMNFEDLRLDVNFEGAFDNGVESISWISHPDLKERFHQLEWFSNDNTNESINITTIIGINDRDENKSLGKKHYKHAQRWQLANTLNALYGYDKAVQLMIEICRGTSKGELQGDVKTASVHNKPISSWAINELNKQHGFKLKIKSEDQYKNEIAKLEDKINNVDDNVDPIKILNSNGDKVVLHMRKDQYLSDIQEDIIKNLSQITLLEAGAGYGKTEMIKALKARTILVLPFTSTIKAKIEADSSTSDWLYYYGNKRPTLDELLSTKSMSMTIDKFSRLNVMELNQANFKYIVIDESHLLFTSSYRDVMGPTIQRLANCGAKVIMMTGTPTGELLFFPKIKHIRVIKDDYRIKEFEVHMVPTRYEKLMEICKSIAQDIKDGKKILWPTNKGNLAYEQITGIIQDYLEEMEYPHKLRSFYYKKSNYGDDTMENININKTIGDKDIIFCSTYLSVGVDICDKSRFCVYFNEPWIAQDIEQFANRLRNNDLYIKLFLEKEDSSGININYYRTAPLDLSISQVDLIHARDLIRTCNDVIERNQEESKYNPILQSLLSANKYLKYDENDCKYYIDETTYKLKVFEDRYSEYSKQLPVMIDGMKYYGYTINKINSDEKIPEEKMQWLESYLKSCKHIRYDWFTTQTFIFLNHLTDENIDTYKELIKGDYAIFKDDKYKEKREEGHIYAESIEILEKNIPIVLKLYKNYDCQTIIDIYKYCVDKKQNKINYAKLNKICKFITIESNRRKRRIDFPIYKFIIDSNKFIKEHYQTTTNELNIWVANYAAKYANSIKDLVVDDILYFEELFEMMKGLFDILVVKSRPKNGQITIRPFELLWENKNDLKNLYGNINTKEFFLQQLIDNMQINKDDEPEDLPELRQETKKTLEEIKNELPNIIHKEFDYYEYSEQDKSNDRFMRKQDSTNSLRENIFVQNELDDVGLINMNNDNQTEIQFNFEET